jgi:transcriptional regulator with GAF, ATPase, and Fis domain
MENKQLKNKLANQFEMIGDSKPMQEVREMIEKVAPTDARALIMGENGTGKELVAHWIHQKSQRFSKPMIEVNCAAIPSELIESELFGHMKGAFTSANKNRAGKFEAADQTTLFLDEVGDMSLSAQAKVLRALQEGKIQRVGSEKTISVNVRVIAATNKNLTKEIEKGNFREDLYHRLAVIVIRVPNLNERAEDIPELADFFVKKIAEEYGSEPKRINDKAKKALQELNWTGNIRELRNVVERLIILGGKTITDKDVKQFSSK